MIRGLISTAVDASARRGSACQLLGLSVRTVERRARGGRCAPGPASPAGQRHHARGAAHHSCRRDLGRLSRRVAASNRPVARGRRTLSRLGIHDVPDSARGGVAPVSRSRQGPRAPTAAHACRYNTQHLHSAIRFVTPDDRHAGRDTALLLARRAAYLRARSRPPERWSGTIRMWEAKNAVRVNPDHDEVAAPARVA